VTSGPDDYLLLAGVIETAVASLLVAVGGSSGGGWKRWKTSGRLEDLLGDLFRVGRIDTLERG